MRKGGARSIVNVASVMGLRSITQIADAAYVASKSAVIGLTRELASQWGRYGIRVNAVAPGFFASEMTAGLGDDADSFPDWLTDQTPIYGRPYRCGKCGSREVTLFANEDQAELDAIQQAMTGPPQAAKAPTTHAQQDPNESFV